MYIMVVISFSFTHASVSDSCYFCAVQLVKLLELREANHIEFCRIKNVLDEILHMYGNCELNEILKLLMDPTWISTGLKIDFETFVSTNVLSCLSFNIMVKYDISTYRPRYDPSQLGLESQFSLTQIRTKFEPKDLTWAKGCLARIRSLN